MVSSGKEVQVFEMEKKGLGYMEKGGIYGYMGLASFVEVLDRYHVLGLPLMHFYIPYLLCPWVVF